MTDAVHYVELGILLNMNCRHKIFLVQVLNFATTMGNVRAGLVTSFQESSHY